MKLPSVKPFGQTAALLTWPSEISLDTHQEVIQAAHFIERRFSDLILDVVPAYCSIAVFFRSEIFRGKFLDEVGNTWPTDYQVGVSEKFLYTIPVCYEEPFALDLSDLAKRKELSPSEVVDRHCAPLYSVAFLGFLPGFPYLLGLNSSLHTSRKVTPRQRVAQGSVGIAGAQTGIYPSVSPGGWNVIGRTPIRLFKAASQNPTLLSAGDRVKFEPIDEGQFNQIDTAIKSGSYIVRKEAYRG
ncbi:MAG: allophanate hydrolase [Flavobacteriaceae bacterium]|nr:allophanate hydrolase [Flavobacteriaceae bacterium]